MIVDFKFQPMDFVTIKVFGINYMGRINFVMFNGFQKKYDCSYAGDSGNFKSDLFLEDELVLSS